MARLRGVTEGYHLTWRHNLLWWSHLRLILLSTTNRNQGQYLVHGAGHSPSRRCPKQTWHPGSPNQSCFSQQDTEKRSLQTWQPGSFLISLVIRYSQVFDSGCQSGRTWPLLSPKLLSSRVVPSSAYDSCSSQNSASRRASLYHFLVQPKCFLRNRIFHPTPKLSVGRRPDHWTPGHNLRHYLFFPLL